MWHALWVWVQHVMGADDVSGKWYGFWSGFAGILERLLELFIIGMMLYWHHNCHHKRCLRWGKHTSEGSPYCSKHHPGLAAKVEKE